MKKSEVSGHFKAPLPVLAAKKVSEGRASKRISEGMSKTLQQGEKTACCKSS